MDRLKSKWNGRKTMNKIKVRVSPSVLDYCQMMEQRVNDLRDQKLRIAAKVENDLEPSTDQLDINRSEKAGLLTPPRIEVLSTDFYIGDDGQIEGIIQMITSDLFGIASIEVTLRDETGKLLEKGQAMPDENWLGCWAYLPDLVPTTGTTLIVRAVAADALGGMNIVEEKLRLTEEYLRTSTALTELLKNKWNPTRLAPWNG